jgi:molybdopterin/thiamine biosynthesis adenylyltransferase
MDNIDDILNSLSITTTPAQPSSEDNAPQPVSTSQDTRSLTENDFDDILSDMGFSEVQEAEIVEDDEDEISSDSSSELEDAEDEEAWDDLIASGAVVRTEDIPENNPSHPVIKENSPTLTVDEATSRFSGTEWFNEIRKAKIILAGLGGIGSWTALQLARLGVDLMCIYDDDVVEAANMSGQFYGYDDIGRTKTSAVESLISKYSGTPVYAMNERFTNTTEAGDIMICGFDNMSARRTFFNSWRAHIRTKSTEDRKKCLFIDGRLSIDTLQVFCITGNDTYNIGMYANKHLFSDAEAEETVCSMKQTTFLACMIGSVITNLFTNFIAGTLNPIIPYDLPFFTEYNSQFVVFKTEN